METALPPAVTQVARALGKPLRQMRVALWTNASSVGLERALATLGCDVVRLAAAAEANALVANLRGGQDAPFDVVIAGGLIEAEIAAILVEQQGGQGWIRGAGIGYSLGLTRAERAAYAAAGVDPAQTYVIRDWVGREQENYAVMSAVTANPWMRLKAPQIDETTGRGQVELVVSDPSGALLKLTVERRLSPRTAASGGFQARLKRALRWLRASA
jgi:hypothetical protein